MCLYQWLNVTKYRCCFEFYDNLNPYSISETNINIMYLSISFSGILKLSYSSSHVEANRKSPNLEILKLNQAEGYSVPLLADNSF